MALVDSNLNPITEEKYQMLIPFKNGHWIYQMPATFKQGFINMEGKEIIPPIYDQID